jgi:hypothetical protein
MTQGGAGWPAARVTAAGQEVAAATIANGLGVITIENAGNHVAAFAARSASRNQAGSTPCSARTDHLRSQRRRTITLLPDREPATARA